MKTKHILSSWFILAVVFFTACSDNKGKEQTPADKKFGKLEVEIPASLQNKPEITTYIQHMAALSDEYALLVDKAIEDAKEFKGKKEEDLGMMDKIKLTKISSEVGFNAIEILGKWGEYTEKRFDMKKELTEDEIQALDAIMKRFEERMRQIEAKHADVFKES